MPAIFGGKAFFPTLQEAWVVQDQDKAESCTETSLIPLFTTSADGLDQLTRHSGKRVLRPQRNNTGPGFVAPRSVTSGGPSGTFFDSKLHSVAVCWRVW